MWGQLAQLQSRALATAVHGSKPKQLHHPETRQGGLHIRSTLQVFSVSLSEQVCGARSL